MHTQTKPQQRLRRFIRQPDRLTERQLTQKGLEAMAVIERYRFIPTSLLVRLVSGGVRNNYRHLQTLFHKGLVNRFALPKYGGPGEFIYYLDSLSSFNLLIEQGLLALSDQERGRREEIIRYNREKDYAKLHRDLDSQGKLLYIQHELMITRFHAMLEMACKKLDKVTLETWKQGPELWNKVVCPKVSKDRDDVWTERKETESLPHRPDAFFTLTFQDGKQAHFLYEADRGTENTTRFKLKLRAHHHFIVRQNLHRTISPYNVHSIRAVLTESTDSNWASQLREAAKHPVIAPRPSPLFWFTTSEMFFSKATATEPSKPLFLEKPEMIFKRIWASPVDDTLLNLAD
jgi:hypothetical protein